MLELRRRLVDDLDGTSTADETVLICFDGVYYRIDLTSRNARALRGVLEPFIRASEKVGSVPVSSVLVPLKNRTPDAFFDHEEIPTVASTTPERRPDRDVWLVEVTAPPEPASEARPTLPPATLLPAEVTSEASAASEPDSIPARERKSRTGTRATRAPFAGTGPGIERTAARRPAARATTGRTTDPSLSGSTSVTFTSPG